MTVKFRLNPKKRDLSYALRCETKTGLETYIFDRAHPEHEIPDGGVERLLELNRGPNADILPVKIDEVKEEIEELDMPTKAEVKNWTKDELADLAKRMGLRGYESLGRTALLGEVQDALPRQKPLPKTNKKEKDDK